MLISSKEKIEIWIENSVVIYICQKPKKKTTMQVFFLLWFALYFPGVICFDFKTKSQKAWNIRKLLSNNIRGEGKNTKMKYITIIQEEMHWFWESHVLFYHTCIKQICTITKLLFM